MNHGPAEVTRAVLEGVAFALSEGLDLMRGVGVDARSGVVAGGEVQERGIDPQEKVGVVTGIFKKYKFLALPVADENGILRGIITLKDILQEELDE